jgi:Integrase core domain
MDGMAVGIKFSTKELENFQCDVVCVLGKVYKVPIYNNFIPRVEKVGQMFHTDVCGPMSVPSINGNMWLCIVVDNVSRLPFLFFMKNKDNAATYIKEYVEMINTQQLSGVKVQRMHSDSGGEFINKDLDKFLKGKGVKQTVSAPHTSEHNGVAERMLRLIISIARCLLIHSGLSQQFWCETVRYACLVYSYVPTKTVDGVMLMECWSGAKPDVSVFHTFRCKCFKIECGKIKKFTFRVTQCIYLEPAAGGDGYCLYKKLPSV